MVIAPVLTRRHLENDNDKKDPQPPKSQNEHSTTQPNWLTDWAVLWVLSSKEFLGIQATAECRFTLKRACDMIRTHSQMHHTDKFSQNSSILQPVWLNDCVFVYKLSGCGFESCYSHLNFRYRACFGQGVPWYSGNYRVLIHSKTRVWHDKNT